MTSFPKNEHSYPLTRIRTCVYQGVRNFLFFFWKLSMLCLKHSFWDSPFCLIADDFYAKFLQSLTVFLKFFIINKLRSRFFTERRATHFINVMIFRQYYQDNNNSFIEILKTPTSNKDYISANSRKSYEWLTDAKI